MTTLSLDTLKSLTEAEKNYLDTLDIIDSKLTPLWMKQLDSIAPDFSELLKCIQDIIPVHKSFFEKLTNVVAPNNLGDLLVHLLKDIERPYLKYTENFINHLNQRNDILDTLSIQQLLHDINSKQRKETITLETLFRAPLQQLNIYKSLFNKSGTVDQYILIQANKLFAALMIKNSLPAMQLDSFHSQIDCTSVTDVITDEHISNFQLQPLSKVLLCDTFNCTELSKRVRLILTVNALLFCSLNEKNKELEYSLLFKPIPIQQISIRTIHTDRELIGEYNIQIWVQKLKLFTMQASTKEDRNMWLGLDINSSTRNQSLLSWAPLNDIVTKYDIRRQSTKNTAQPKSIRTQDIFSFYTDQAGEISPLVSSSDESENEGDDGISWEEEGKSNISDKDMFSSSDNIKSLQKDMSNVTPSSSVSNSDLNMIQQKKSLPPSPERVESIASVPNLPLVPPKDKGNHPNIVSGTKSLPTRNVSLKHLPIPSSMLVPDVNTPTNNPAPVRPPNARSLSAHQTMNGIPVPHHQQQHLQNRPPLPIHDSHLQQQQHQQQQPSLPPHNFHPQQSSPLPSHNSPYLQQRNQLPLISPEPTPKKSFMRSVMTAVSSPRLSFRQSKSNLKESFNETASTQTASTSSTGNTQQTSPVRGLPSKNGSQNISTVSLDQQTKPTTDLSTQLRRYSAANLSEPQLSPQHLNIPPPQSPFGPRASTINNHSTPSFISSANSSSQSSLALTPPLSRSSSPGSMTPAVLNRYTTASSSSSEDLGSPPESPDIITHGNTIKSVLYSNSEVHVFRWKDESWYAVEGPCLLEVRQTFSNRSCIAVHMKNSGQLYLNAWVLPDTFISRPNDTDLSLSLHITNDQSALENYLIHCESKQEADTLSSVVEKMHQESIKMNMVISATSTLRGAPPVLIRSSSLAANNTLSQEELAKTFKLAMQCKCKLFVQSASSKWNSFGSVYMKVSQQYTTKKMHVAMESHKGGKTTQLVSAMVQSRNVERLGPKRISFLMVDELERNSVVYMVQVREELTCDKIFEYVKTKNAENGW